MTRAAAGSDRLGAAQRLRIRGGPIVSAIAVSQPNRAARLARSRPVLLAGLAVCAGLLLLALLSSIAFGAANITPQRVWAALVAPDGSTDHLIIRTLRVPRAAVAALVGASLAVAGALMQGVTRNPLAAPGLLGVNAGAALGVVAAVFLLKITSLSLYALFAFAGAALAAVAVYALGALGGRGGPTPFSLAIAGAALTALLGSLTTGLLIMSQRTLDEVRFWLAGSVAGRDLTLLLQAAPYLLAGLVLALALGRQITALSLGEEVARGLGQRTGWVKGLAAVAVVLLAGGSVAVAGPIGFVGLVVPHVVRFVVGVDYRWILPYAVLVGATFLVLADVGARLLLRPIELPVGVMTALIGGPFFVWLVRWRVTR
jgi:iron complex transport system permease protein